MADFSVYKYIGIVISVCLIGLSGCSSGGGDGPVSVSTTVESVDASGGIVQHPNGFAIEFPAGALTDSVTVSLTEVSLPGALPGNILAGNRAYKIDGLENIDLNIPAIISFSQTDVNTSLPSGAQGIYRWDGLEWSFVGGVLDTQAGTISTQVRAFSVFILGTGASLHKTITFNNGDLLYDYVVSPYQYSLTYPLMDSPISSLSVAVFARADYTARMSLAQGIYTFCMDWDSGEIDEQKRIIYNHRFIGDYPDNPAITVTEDTNDTVPPLIHATVSGASYVGLCPGPVNMGPAVDAGTGINLGDPEITLTWNNDNDLDLWVSGPAGDISWENEAPLADSGQLDVDDVCDDVMIGGPEHIYWTGQSQLFTGTYQVWVNHFIECGVTLPESIPRLRLVIGDNVDYFPGTDVATDIVMRPDFPGPNWCLIYEFERGQWPPLKCGRNFTNCCLYSALNPF